MQRIKNLLSTLNREGNKNPNAALAIGMVIGMLIMDLLF